MNPRATIILAFFTPNHPTQLTLFLSLGPVIDEISRPFHNDQSFFDYPRQHRAGHCAVFYRRTNLEFIELKAFDLRFLSRKLRKPSYPIVLAVIDR